MSTASPSIENTVSDTMIGRTDDRASAASSLPRSPWGYTVTPERESRQPSMIDAWFSSSEKTRAPSVANTDSTERLAAKPVGNTTASSHRFHAASSDSRATCTGRVPVTRREAPEPEPQRSNASWAAATTTGCEASPR